MRPHSPWPPPPVRGFREPIRRGVLVDGKALRLGDRGRLRRAFPPREAIPAIVFLVLFSLALFFLYGGSR